MTRSFFPAFDRWSGNLRIDMFTKADALHDDDAVRHALSGTPVASLHQEHGGACVVIDAPTARTIRADAMATDVPGLALTIRSADCQTFVLYAPSAHAAAVVHAGWKGLLANILPHTVAVLRATWNIDPAEIAVAAAPSLCLQCAEFTDPARELPGIDPRFFHGRCADLRGIADRQLVDAGIKAERIDRHADCTRCNPQTYWTYRGGDREAVLGGATNVLCCTLLAPEKIQRSS